jgi:hypothetical protein
MGGSVAAGFDPFGKQGSSCLELGGAIFSSNHNAANLFAQETEPGTRQRV